MINQQKYDQISVSIGLDCSNPSPGSSGGRVVKLLACGARGPGFDSRSRHLNFQRLVMLPSRDMAERSLNRHLSSKQPTNQPQSKMLTTASTPDTAVHTYAQSCTPQCKEKIDQWLHLNLSTDITLGAFMMRWRPRLLEFYVQLCNLCRRMSGISRI